MGSIVAFYVTFHPVEPRLVSERIAGYYVTRPVVTMSSRHDASVLILVLDRFLQLCSFLVLARAAGKIALQIAASRQNPPPNRSFVPFHCRWHRGQHRGHPKLQSVPGGLLLPGGFPRRIHDAGGRRRHGQQVRPVRRRQHHLQRHIHVGLLPQQGQQLRAADKEVSVITAVAVFSPGGELLIFRAVAFGARR